jgi:hypothetical protein
MEGISMPRFFARVAFVLAFVFLVAGFSMAVESSTPLPEVSASGKLSAHLSVVTDLVPFTFTFRNGTGNELQDLRIANLPAGYKLHDLCVNPPQACLTAKELETGSYGIAKAIPAGGSLVVWGDFTASPPHKPQTLFLVLQWGIQGLATQAKTTQNLATKDTTTATTIYSSLAVDLGENEVQSKCWAWVVDYSPIFLLPVAIPIVLAGCTYLFNLFAGWSSRRAEIWKQMLPASHGYSTKFYMPMSSAADGLSGELKNSNPEVAFFFFLLLLRIVLDSIAEIGGFYFKDHRGETLANACWSGIWDVFFPKGRKSAIYVQAYAAAELVDPQFTYEDFARRYFVQSGKQITFANFDIQQCWELFCTDIPQAPPAGETSASFEKLTLLLQAFSTTLDCEVNRPYKYWYTALVPVKVKAEVLKLLQDKAKEEEINWWQRFTYFYGWKVD